MKASQRLPFGSLWNSVLIMKTMGMNPRINPNDGDKITWKPPRPPAKTGSPIKPTRV